jgi:hypothetical protein
MRDLLISGKEAVLARLAGDQQLNKSLDYLGGVIYEHHDFSIGGKLAEYVLRHHVKVLRRHQRERSGGIKPEYWAHIPTDINTILVFNWRRLVPQ